MSCFQVDDPTWRDVVSHFHRLSEAELTMYAQVRCITHPLVAFQGSMSGTLHSRSVPA